MSTNGILDFQNTNKVIFRGTDSNVVVDTSNASLGIGIQGTEKPGSNLHVIGDASISSNLKLTTDTSILVNSNVVTDFNGPHARLPKEVPLKKYPEIIFEEGKFDGSRTSTDATYDEQYYLQAGTTVKVVSETTSRVAHQAFNGDIVGANENGWHTQFGFDRNTGLYDTSNNRGDTFTDTNGDPHLGMWIQTKFPNKIKVKNINLYIGNNLYRYPKSLVVLGHSSLSSLTGWTLLHTETNISTTTPAVGDTTPTVLNVNADTAFDCYTILVKSARPEGIAGQQSIWVSEIEYYGYEEDPPAGDTSVDTTFTSIMNTPQTTGANVYVDGSLGETFTNRVTGPTPVGPTVTHDNTNKYWEMNGQLTSNITVEANTFLEGDQPHAVSVWFNSSNLEANVSNTCVFSVSDQEHLNSENLDLQSNTWHNLTYSYQGEGGSRVTYLDGRKVAEDQAEDTFGEYPPFAMTGYSQGGYVLSVDADHDGTNKIWKAFDGDDSSTSVWFSQPGSLDADSSYQAGYARGNAGQSVTDTNGTTHSGSWGKIEFPYKFVLNYVRVHGGTPISSYWPHNPDNYVILGSNDDTNWDLLTTRTGANDGSNGMTAGGTNIDQHPVNATKAYKYVKFLVTKLGSTSGDREFIIATLKLYGHRENDLVRLPDPNRVLKYPHIAMTGPAQRGYVASSSTIENAIYPSWKVFNGNSNTGSGSGSASWVSKGDAFTNGTSNSNYGFDFGSGQVDGPWLRLDVPHKLKLEHVDVYRRDGAGYDQYPKSGYIYGYDGTTWHLLKTFTNITQPPVLNATTISIDSNIPVSSIVMLITERYDGATTTNQFVIIKQLEYYGTGVDSIPIQIGGGNIDKVANFRVYDKFVGEDQALEIWDAQKDEFGRAKSSMTLQKGRLGIGTDEPEGRLAVADEPHAPEEFPPKAMTAEETYMEGHGVFKATADSHGAGSSNVRHPWKAFIKGTAGSTSNGDNSWLDNSADFNSTTGVYDGSLTHHSGSVAGEYLQLELPYEIQLSSYSLAPWNYPAGTTFQYSDFPRDFIIYGSKDSISWDIVDTRSGQSSISQTDVPKYHVNSHKTYRYFVIVVTKINTLAYANGAIYVAIGEWRLFGTREQRQSVLHDGQLTLTKSLNVPRIGPALDADDTPRRDRLVVEYNTSTNPTSEGAVKDTSGRGLDAILRDATYDATDKSFRVGTSQDIILEQGIPGKSGDVTNVSYSIWFKADGVSATNQIIMTQISQYSTGVGLTLALNTNELQFGFGYAYSSGQQIGGAVIDAISAGQWYHVVAIKKGSGTLNATTLPDILEIYINGEKKTLSHGGGTGTLNVGTDHWLIIGAIRKLLSGRTSEEFIGNVSSIKYYDTALTASEVKTLYDMGRCDEGHHVVNFSKTRVGIGLGDGEAPRSALDVRDLIYAESSTVQTFTGQHKCVPEEPVEKGLIVSASQNKYIKLNGGLDSGKSAITIDESLPVVSLSSVAKDKACFGVVSSMEEANSLVRVETVGGVISDAPKTLGDNRAIVNSVGEGAIWVVNTGGSLESGDYITTSNVAGYGQKQEDDVLHNYTVAKITMDCDFTATEVPLQVIKREETGLRTITEDEWNTLVDYDRSSTTETQYSNTLEPEAYTDQPGYTPREVTTIVDYTDGTNTISVEEWSNLESNIQSTYQSNTFTEIMDYIRFVTADEWSNLTSNVQNTFSEAEITTYYQIQRGENVLDENGQLQWEDKTGATEAPYERRFLDASGAQTDEANAVHIAAFVGCTYHCG